MALSDARGEPFALDADTLRLSQADVVELLRAFRAHCDVDGTGDFAPLALSRGALARLLRVDGARVPEGVRDGLLRLFPGSSGRGRAPVGVVTFRSFCVGVAAAALSSPATRLERAAALCDADGDGRLARAEVVATFEGLWVASAAGSVLPALSPSSDVGAGAAGGSGGGGGGGSSDGAGGGGGGGGGGDVGSGDGPGDRSEWAAAQCDRVMAGEATIAVARLAGWRDTAAEDAPRRRKLTDTLDCAMEWVLPSPAREAAVVMLDARVAAGEKWCACACLQAALPTRRVTQLAHGAGSL